MSDSKLPGFPGDAYNDPYDNQFRVFDTPDSWRYTGANEYNWGEWHLIEDRPNALEIWATTREAWTPVIEDGEVKAWPR